MVYVGVYCVTESVGGREGVCVYICLNLKVCVGVGVRVCVYRCLYVRYEYG